MKDEAYGVGIKRKIEESTGKDMAYGTLYFLLDQLTAKELVFKIVGEPTPERGGRSKTYYQLTPQGINALKASMKMYEKVWGDISQLSFESGMQS